MLVISLRLVSSSSLFLLCFFLCFLQCRSENNKNITKQYRNAAKKCPKKITQNAHTAKIKRRPEKYELRKKQRKFPILIFKQLKHKCSTFFSTDCHSFASSSPQCVQLFDSAVFYHLNFPFFMLNAHVCFVFIFL